MAEETDNVAQALAESAAPANTKNPFVSAMLIVNAVLLGVVAYLQFSAHQRELHRPDIRDIVVAHMNEVKDPDNADSAVKAAEGELLPLEPFTANLAQGDGPRRFIQLTVVIRLTQTSKKQEMEAKNPQIRDSIISVLNSKHPEDLLKAEGKEYLKEEIKAAVNSFLVDSKIADVFYVGFQVN